MWEEMLSPEGGERCAELGCPSLQVPTAVDGPRAARAVGAAPGSEPADL